MARLKAATFAPAVDPIALTTTENGRQVYKDAEGDVVYFEFEADRPQGIPQATFMGIPTAPPSEGTTHSILVKMASDIAAIKSRLGI